MMTDSTIAFIGLGLIGGSIARGIKRANPDTTIMAYRRTRSRLEQAKADGIVDVIFSCVHPWNTMPSISPPSALT